jgi:hypothetical protein
VKPGRPTAIATGSRTSTGGEAMTAYNVVRFKVKPGKETEVMQVWKEAPVPSGAAKGCVVKTGDNAYCFIGEWDSLDSIVAARPEMIAQLDRVRPLLEDLGNGLGVTDPVSGEVVLALR